MQNTGGNIGCCKKKEEEEKKKNAKRTAASGKEKQLEMATPIKPKDRTCTELPPTLIKPNRPNRKRATSRMRRNGEAREKLEDPECSQDRERLGLVARMLVAKMTLSTVV